MGIRKFVCRQVGQVVNGMMGMALGVLPAGGEGDELRVDVREGPADLVVVADLPGVEKENLAVRLLSPTRLAIAGARCSERVETAGGGTVARHERTCGRLERVVPLPSPATAACAEATLENGVLRVRLEKAEVGERIPVG